MMEPYDLAQVCAFLAARDRFLLLTHRRCDGDTLGSAAALCRGLRSIGKTAYVARNEDVTPRLDFLCRELRAPADYAPETVVAVDIADEGLRPASLERFRGRSDLLLIGIGRPQFRGRDAAPDGGVDVAPRAGIVPRGS